MTDFSGLKENKPVVISNLIDEQSSSSEDVSSVDGKHVSSNENSIRPSIDDEIHSIFRVRHLVVEKIQRPPSVLVKSQKLSKIEVYPKDCEFTTLLLVDSSEGHVTIYLDDKEDNIISDEITIKDMGHSSSSFNILIRSHNIIEGYNKNGERVLERGGYIIDSVGGSVTYRLTKLQEKRMWLILSENTGNLRK